MEKLSFSDKNLTLDVYEVNDIIIEKDNYKNGLYILSFLVALSIATLIVSFSEQKSKKEHLKDK